MFVKKLPVRFVAFFLFIETSIICFGAGTVPNTESEDAEMLKNIDLLKNMELLQNFELIEGQSDIEQASGSQTANPNVKSKGKSL